MSQVHIVLRTLGGVVEDIVAFTNETAANQQYQVWKETESDDADVLQFITELRAEV